MYEAEIVGLFSPRRRSGVVAVTIHLSPPPPPPPLRRPWEEEDALPRDNILQQQRRRRQIRPRFLSRSAAADDIAIVVAAFSLFKISRCKTVFLGEAN